MDKLTLIEGGMLLVEALELAEAALARGKVIGAAITKANEEGRASFTDAEWLNIQATATGPLEALKKDIAIAHG